MKHLFKDASTNYHFWVLLLILILQRIVVLFVFNANYTDNDQTLTWLIAKDYSEGNFYQPFMYGQDYNYMIEALLAVPLLWCKVPPEYALPAVANFLAIIPFISFAFWFRRTKKMTAAIFMLVIPLMLPVTYALITSMPRGFINGLAFFAVWPWIERIKRIPVRYTLYGFVLAAALVTNANVIFIAVLLSGLAFFQSEKKMQFVMYLLVGASIPALLHFGAKIWVDNHQSAILHHAWNLEWTAEYFMGAVPHAPDFFKGCMPFTETYGHWAWFIFPALCLYAFIRKNYPLAVLLGIISAGVIFSFGVNKVNDGTGDIFYPVSRMFLALPLVLAVACAALVNEQQTKRFAFAVLVVSGIFVGIQFQRMGNVISEEVRLAGNSPVRAESIDVLKFKTQQLLNFAGTNSIRYFAGAGYPLAYGEQQALFHAGESWYGGFPSCALPEYERREWQTNKVLAAQSDSTAWIGGMEHQWLYIDQTMGRVVVMDVADMQVYRVDSTIVKNRDVFNGLQDAKRKAIGE